MLSFSLALAATLLAHAAAAASWAEGLSDGAYTSVSAGSNFARDQSFAEFDDGPVMGWSAGYVFAPGFRPEVELTTRQNETETPGVTEISDDASSVMVNHWIDLPGPFFAPRLRPYFGVGGGRASLERVETAGTSEELATVWAYQAGAGVGYDFNQRLALSLGWRYFATETPEFSSGTAPRYRSDAVLATLRFAFGRTPMRAEAEPVSQPPAAAALPPEPQAEIAAFETVVLRAVNFKFDRSELTEPARMTLDELAARLVKHPEVRVTVEGHTDSIGTEEYNMGLGQRRAQTVADYLANAGVQGPNITLQSYGESQPVASNKTAEGRATNRRAQFSVPDEPANVRIVIEPPTEESVDAAVDTEGTPR
jgi:OOP family OmpA-OmpF porin